MNDETLPRTPPFTQLKWSLQSLAQAGSVQPPLFPEQALTADELAFGFEQWSSAVREAHRAEITSAQGAALEAISGKLATMSRDGAEFDADLWTDAALATSEHWTEVRRLARSALIAFDWQIEGAAPSEGETVSEN